MMQATPASSSDIGEKKDKKRSHLDWTFEGRSSGWLYVVGVAFLILFLHYGGVPLALLIGLLGDTSEWPPLVSYAVQRLPLILYLAVPLLWVHFVHGRPWWSIAFPRLALEVWNLGIGALFAFLALVVSWMISAQFFGVTLTFGFPDPATYWPTFIFAIAFVFMQTTCEELVFRGYGMQAVRRFTASPVAIIVVTALLFAVPHYSNVVSAGRPWWGLISYALPAVLFAWMAMRTGSLWMPIGWHWLNNFFLTRVLVVRSDVAGGSDAFAHADGQPPLAASLAIQIVLYVLIALAINYLVSRREAAGGDRGDRLT